MIVVDLWPMVELRGGRRVTSYLTARGFTYGQARTLANGHTLVQIRDRTVLQVCEALSCTPNGIFGWSGAETDALAVLNSGRPSPLHRLAAGLEGEELEAFWLRARELDEQLPARAAVSGGQLRLDAGRLVRMRTNGSVLKELQRRGLTEMEARAVLSDWRAGLRMGVLTKLCKAFDCLPNDLYSFEGPEGHVLSGLKRAPLVDPGRLSDEALRGMR